MTDLHHRKQKIQEKRKTTPWREFVKQIASWQPNVFYKVDGLTSRFPRTDRVGNVIKYSEFYEQVNEVYTEGMDYDPTTGFFEQWKALWMSIDMTNMINFFMSENCDFADVVSKCRNIYLTTYCVNANEDVVYSFGIKDNCSRVFNSAIISDNCENIFSSLSVSNSYEVLYSRYIANSSHIWFSTNLQGCDHCLFCNGLENKSYCIENKEVGKEEYKKKLSEYLADTSKYEAYYAYRSTTPAVDVASSNITGNYAVESHDLENAHYPYRVTTGRNLFNVGGSEGNSYMYDVVDGGGPELHHIYGVNAIAINTEHAYLCCHIPNCNHVFYSYYLESCSYCLGCIGLKNREYCIFNKQYTKDERYEKANEIFANMEKEGILGEFFPAKLNPFYHNDTVAALIEDFERDEIIADGYLWRDEPIQVDIPQWMDVVEVKDLGEYEENKAGKRTIDPSILKKVIKDEEGNVYRVIKMEYDFLMRYGLPLPRKHWLQRIKGHFTGK